MSSIARLVGSSLHTAAAALLALLPALARAGDGGAGTRPVPAAAAAPPAAPGAVPLTVRVSGLRSERGLVAVALFSSKSSFPDQRQALAGQVARVTRAGAVVTFPNVPPGLYAVAVLHDENENAKMDFNFLGMPLEGYGFSNDASALFGPPSFAAAAFRLSPRPSYVAVKLRYLL